MARKILLADDSVTAQNMGRKILTDAGYEVLTVNNGSAALKRVAEHKPDLIVLDVYMPGYSGLEVCMRLKDSGETARIPILLTVGKLEPFKPEDARRVRADAFIVKPFEASELLSALTRLEDRVVPQSDGQRFSSNINGVERFSGETSAGKSESSDDTDSGWKNRLRFPSKKPRAQEPEPEADYVTTPGFRSFRREPPKEAPKPTLANAEATEAAAEAVAAKEEPALVPDIPRDITPEELDALSAVAAKLDAPAKAEDVVPPTAKAEASAPVDLKSETKQDVTSDTKPETPTPSAESALSVAVAPQAISSSPVQSDVSGPKKTDSATGEEAVSDAPASLSTSETAPAPVDREDEPLFAAAPQSAKEIGAEIVSESGDSAGLTKNEAGATAGGTKPGETEEKTKTEDSPKVDEVKPEVEEPATATAVEGAPETEKISAATQSKLEDQSKAQEVTPAAEAVAVEEKTPTDAELAEALQLLTPSHGAADRDETMPEGLAAAGAALVEELARGTGGTRWAAEAVALNSEEASLSLESEMFRAVTTPPAVSSASAQGIEPAFPSAFVSESTISDKSAIAEPPVAPAPTPTSTLEGESTVTVSKDQSARAEERESAPEEQTSEAPDVSAEEVEPTTFADAVQYAEAEPEPEASSPSSVQTGEPVETAPAQAQDDQDTSSENAAGGQESMVKDAKGKSGKSGWHQIRTGSAPAATTDVVEAAKQAVPEEAPKAMAAAAAADNGSASSADPNAIASIVDSVLADLRPKIVEEIAKKLTKK